MKFLKFLSVMLLAFLLIGGTAIAKNVPEIDDGDDDEETAQVLLSPKQKDIVLVSAYTASGDLANLKKAVKSGLTNGELTVNEIKEVMIQLYAYCGFPRSLNALGVLLEESKNGAYMFGDEGQSLDKRANKNKIGTKKQTKLVGKKVKGEIYTFAPAIDAYLKEHLFADIFSRGILDDQEREIATIAALSSMDDVTPQLLAHIQIGKNVGLNQKQIDEILKVTRSTKQPLFGQGEPNTAYAKYFIGQSYLQPLCDEQVHISNVTFEPKCRNNWHIHHKGGQILLVTEGRGWYQEWDKEPRELKKGDVVNIPPEVKHWHGAAKDSWFTHIAIAVPAEDASTEWLEEVSDEEYNKLP